MTKPDLIVLLPIGEFDETVINLTAIAEKLKKEHIYYWSDDSDIVYHEGLVEDATKAPKNDTLMEQKYGYNQALSDFLELIRSEK